MAILASAALQLAALVQAGGRPMQDAAFEVTFQYSLSTVTGVIPFAGARLSLDPGSRELLVISDGQVRIFNEGGMEVYAFDDPEIGAPAAAVSLGDGDLVVLAYSGETPRLVRCNFRGEPVSEIKLTGIPAGFAADFRPGSLVAQGGRLYLADKGSMKVLVAGLDGGHLASWDLARLLEVGDKRRDVGIRGFNVDRDGNILFTVQSFFRAYVLSPAGALRSFGERGSAPGKFNVVGGIARDEDGNLYVADILKSAVLVFDRDFRWIKEFGHRGRGPGNLAAPEDVVAGNGKVWVAQNARRGVNVYQVTASATQN
jgi:hypothetical protein